MKFLIRSHVCREIGESWVEFELEFGIGTPIPWNLKGAVNITIRPPRPGVYFARDASYSAHLAYSQPDAGGVQRIFLCRLVVGDWCKGTNGQLTPEAKKGTMELFDTTVDNVRSPSIFVAYHDAQVRLAAAPSRCTAAQSQLLYRIREWSRYLATSTSSTGTTMRPNQFSEWNRSLSFCSDNEIVPYGKRRPTRSTSWSSRSSRRRRPGRSLPGPNCSNLAVAHEPRAIVVMFASCVSERGREGPPRLGWPRAGVLSLCAGMREYGLVFGCRDENKVIALCP